MKKIIIQGSAKSDGNTHKLVQLLMKEMDFDLVDLNQKDIAPFDYEFKNQDDDFPPLIRDIADNYDLIIFATPVYWYSMSGTMKIFFDRISDCLKIDKETGRKLRGKSMAALSCGSYDSETETFFAPFKNTAEYLGMSYLGDVHTWADDDGNIEKEVVSRVRLFANNVKKYVNSEINTNS